MIEVNLVPGSRNSSSRGGISLSLPSFGGFDRGMVLLGLLLVGALGGIGWMWFSSETAREETELALEEARADSVRFADILERTELLRARNDSVVQRVSVIQEIDQGRYVWPHVLDEVARALPEYTWLDEVIDVGGGGLDVNVRIGGKAGNLFAQSVFMQQLEASPFLRDVRLVRSEQTIEQTQSGERGQVVYTFQLEASYENPSDELIETIPLFAADAQPEGGLRPPSGGSR